MTRAEMKALPLYRVWWWLTICFVGVMILAILDVLTFPNERALVLTFATLVAVTGVIWVFQATRE